MEGAAGDVVGAWPDQPRHPVAHFVSRLVGEGHGSDAVGPDAVVVYQVRDAVGNDPGLAAARSGDNQQRALDGGDSFGLSRV